MNIPDFEFLANMDSNPLIVFNPNGKIVYLNDSAEILMGYVSNSEIYNLALNNAPKDYGIKNSKMELVYDHLNFYSISVGYNSDEWIAIKLYYRPLSKKYANGDAKQHILTDINKMLSVAIHQYTIDKDIDIRLFADSDLPHTMLNQNEFLKLLRMTLSTFRGCGYLDISLKLGIGEHLLVNGKSYKISILKLKSSSRNRKEDKEIDELANRLCIVPNLQESSISFDIPIIQE